MSEPQSAAALIKRFREAKPTSRDDRLKQNSGNQSLWYESSTKDDLEKPRSVPIPVMQSAKPTTTTNSLLQSFRKPHDNITKSSALDSSFDIDSIFQRNIQDEYTKKLTNNRDQPSSHHLNPRFSFDLDSSGDKLNFGRRSPSPGPTFRFGGGGGGGGGGDGRYNSVERSRDFNISPVKSRDFGRDYNISPFQSRDFGRVSVETLGSTGFRGLLAPDLRLDGRQLKKEEETDKPEPLTTEGLEHIHSNLAELMKSMAEGQLKRSEENAFFPEGVAHTIPQVAIKLDADMMEFKSLFPHHAEEDRQEALLKKRDKDLVEQGRKEERDKHLLDTLGGEVDYYITPYHPHHQQKQQQLQHLQPLQRLQQQHWKNTPTPFPLFPTEESVRGTQRQLSRDEDLLKMRNHHRNERLQRAPLNLSALQVSGDGNILHSREADGPGSSPFSMLDGSNANARETFPVDNRSESHPAIVEQPYIAQDELSAQQIRELLVRVSERGGDLIRQQNELYSSRAGSSPNHRDLRTTHAQRSDGPVFYHPIYGLLVPAHSEPAVGTNPQTWRGFSNGLEERPFDENAWQPAPPVEHKSLSTTAKGIVSSLRAMETSLHARLPPDISTMSLADRIRATMESDAAAAGNSSATVSSSGASNSSPIKSRFGAKAATPSTETKSTILAVPTATVISTDKEVVENMAASLINAILAPGTPPSPVEIKSSVVANSSPSPAVVAPATVVTATPDSGVTAIDVNKKVMNKNTFGLKPVVGVPKIVSSASTTSGPKSHSQVLNEMDSVLGIDNYRRVWGSGHAEATGRRPLTTLGLGQFVPPANAAAAKDIMRVAGNAVSSSKLPMSSPQLPLPWEASPQPASVDLRTLHGLKSPVSRPVVVVQAPSDEQLFLRQQQHSTDGGVGFASAPPYQLDHSTHAYHNPSSPRDLRQQWSLPTGGDYHTQGPPLRRPVEGFAMDHLRATRHQQEQEQSTYLSPMVIKSSVSSHGGYVNSTGNAHSSPVSITAVSPSASLHEREAHLRRMKQMRQAMIAY